MKWTLYFVLPIAVVAGAWSGARALAPEARVRVSENLRSGNADAAIRSLDAALAADPADAEAHTLLCRAYYGEERWDDAIRECQQAVAADPQSSAAHLWLGRADGEKADRAPLFTAYGLAKRLHAEFETAVALDPHNVEALSDLGEYYAEAPALVGGGIGKAQSVAARLDGLDRTRAEELRAHIATAQKHFAAAEQHLRAAVAASPEPAESWMALAAFYGRRGEWDKMRSSIQAGVAADRTNGPALVDGARVLIRSGRDLDTAVQMLRAYLASAHKSAEEPAYQVHVLLARALRTQGDEAGASRHLAAATVLASGYRAVSASAPTNTGR